MKLNTYLLCCYFFLQSITGFSQVDVFEHITTKNGLPSNFVFSVVQDSKGFLWAGTDKGLCRYNGSYWQTWDIEDGLPGNYINRLLVLSDDFIQMTISEKGEYKFKIDEIENLKFLPSDQLQTNKQNIKQNNSKPQKSVDSIINFGNYFSEVIIHKKNIYVPRLGHGVYHIDSNNNVTLYSKNWGLSTNDVNSVYVTKNDQVLVCTLGEGIQVLVKNQKHDFVYNESRILQITSNNNTEYILTKGKLLAIQNYVLKKIPIPSSINKIGHIRNTLVAANFLELYFANLSNNLVQIKKSIPFTAGVSGIIDFDNYALVSAFGSPMFKIEIPSLREKKIYTGINKNVEYLVKLNNTQFAALTTDNGCFIADTSLKKITHFTTKNGLLSNNVSYALAVNDTIYIATKKGISVYNEQNLLYTITNKEGFLGNKVFTMFKDDNKTIWLQTNSHLLYLQQPNLLLPFTHSKIFNNTNDAIVGANYNTNTKQLFIGKTDGLTVLNINTCSITSEKTPTITTHLFFYQKEAKGTTISLPYNYKVATIKCEVGFTNFNHAQKIQYSINGDEWKWANDSLHIEINNLQPGKYRVQLQYIQSNGQKQPPFVSYTFTVNNPWWLQWWFLLLILITIGGFIYYFTKRYTKKRFLQQLQIQQQVEDERKRISRDLHDNMGAYTTALLSNVDALKQRGITTDLLQKMQTNSQEILNSLKDTIWLLNNRTANLQELIDSYKTHTKKIIENFPNLEFEFEEGIEKNIELSSTKTLHIKKILHEVLQNCIKHSEATLYKVQVVGNNQNCQITISDNGKGFLVDKINFGDGLLNMQWRAEEAGIEFFVHSSINNGTVIKLFL